MLILPKKISLINKNHAIQKVKRDFPGFKVLIGADMNATIGEESFGPWEYHNNDQLETNDNGTRLVSLSNEKKLFLLTSLYSSKAIHRHTWYSPTGFTKRLDYILAEWHLKKLCNNCRVYMDFVLRCAEHEVLQKFPNTGLEYSYRTPGHCSTREQRSIYGLNGTQRLRMILYADDIAVLSTVLPRI